VVSVLIELRRTIARHQVARAGVAWLAFGAILGLACALGTLVLGLAHYQHPGAGVDVVALVLALWMLGRVAQSALAGGDGTLRPELFALLPIPLPRLARSLLIAGLADASLLVVGIAYAATIALGARSGPVEAVVGVVAVLLSLVLTSVLSTIAAGVLGPSSRRGHDAGTIVVAVGLSAIAVAGTLLPLLARTLERRSAPWLSVLVRVLPSGWGPVAVDAAARSQWALVAGALLGTAALTVAVAAAWPPILGRRMHGATGSDRGVRGGRGRPRALPATATGAVAGKELRLWRRDPIRLTCLLIAAIVGTAAFAIPAISGAGSVLLPFAGAMTAVIAGACACNLYGNDGTSLWLTIATPHSSAADVHGRALAWLLIVAPFVLASTVVLTAVSGQAWAWPWVLAGVPALLGGAAGLCAYGSLVSVQPLDDTGSPTPAWSLKVHVALVVVALTALPPLVVLAAGQLAGARWLLWAAVPFGLATGVVEAVWLGRLAARRLRTRGVEVLRTIVDATSAA
jgi:ABC-2 type transport system permease protein